MADLLGKASTWLAGQRKKHLTVTVTYRRGVFFVSLLATRGETNFEEEDGIGPIVRTESRDFLIEAADLILNSLVELPKRGDKIEDVIGSQTFVYEVTAPRGVPHFRFSDTTHQTLRIHTKHVGTL